MIEICIYLECCFTFYTPHNYSLSRHSFIYWVLLHAKHRSQDTTDWGSHVEALPVWRELWRASINPTVSSKSEIYVFTTKLEYFTQDSSNKFSYLYNEEEWVQHSTSNMFVTVI